VLGVEVDGQKLSKIRK